MIKKLNNSCFNSLPDACLFDLDNTLYAYDPAHHAAMEALRKKMLKLFSITPKAFDEAFTEARASIKQRLGHTAASHSRLLYIQRMLEIMGLGAELVLTLDLEQTYWRTFLNEAQLFDGVLEFLDELRLLEIPMAIVTDLTAQIQFRKMVYWGLDRYFNCIVTSEEMGVDKPHPAPFQMALSKLQPKGQCIWMIGDNEVNDIQGGKDSIQAITWQKLAQGKNHGEGPCEPHACFDDYTELRQFTQELAQNTEKKAHS